MGVDMGGRYGGKASSRVKIFDDESEEEEQDEGDGDEDEEEDELDEDDEEEDEEEDDEEEDEEDDEEEDDDEEEEADEPHPRPTPSGKALDPVSALRESRQKDIEKGRGIKRQRVSYPQHANPRTSSTPSSPFASRSRKPSTRASKSHPRQTLQTTQLGKWNPGAPTRSAL